MMVRRFSQRLDAQRLADIIRALEEFEGAKKIQLLSLKWDRHKLRQVGAKWLMTCFAHVRRVIECQERESTLCA